MTASQNHFLLLILCHQIPFINSPKVHLPAILYNYNGRRGRMTLPVGTAKLIKGLQSQLWESCCLYGGTWPYTAAERGGSLTTDTCWQSCSIPLCEQMCALTGSLCWWTSPVTLARLYFHWRDPFCMHRSGYTISYRTALLLQLCSCNRVLCQHSVLWGMLLM